MDPLTDEDTATLGERNRALQTAWYGEPLGERIKRPLAELGLSQSAFAEVLGISAPMLSQLMSGARAKISNPAVLARLQTAERYAGDPAFRALPEAERWTRLSALREKVLSNPSGPAATGLAVNETASNDLAPLGLAQPASAQLGSAELGSTGLGSTGHGTAANSSAVNGSAVNSSAAGQAEMMERRVGSDPVAWLERGGDPARAVQALLHAVASAAELAEAADLLAERQPAIAAALRIYGLGRTAEARAHYVRVVG
jgi:transcriptional regulator with XRE-family HTH domain